MFQFIKKKIAQRRVKRIADAYNQTLRDIDNLPEIPLHKTNDARDILEWSASGVSLFLKNFLIPNQTKEARDE